MATSHAAVGAFVAQEYGLEVVGIVAGPRGWVGETFIVSSADGQRYFAKLFNPQNAFRAPESSLLVLEQLRLDGISNLIYPLRTSSDTLSMMFGEMR